MCMYTNVGIVSFEILLIPAAHIFNSMVLEEVRLAKNMSQLGAVGPTEECVPQQPILILLCFQMRRIWASLVMLGPLCAISCPY